MEIDREEQVVLSSVMYAGTIIGADAFYFKRRKERDVQYDKMESCGRVVIHDNVEILFKETAVILTKNNNLEINK